MYEFEISFFHSFVRWKDGGGRGNGNYIAHEPIHRIILDFVKQQYSGVADIQP